MTIGPYSGNLPSMFFFLRVCNQSLFHPCVLLNHVQGENNCAAGGNPCCPNGFTAAPGFDPLSGLGSVNFGQLLKVLVSM